MVKQKSILTEKYLLKILSKARQNLQRDGKLVPCIQFKTSDNKTGIVAFESFGAKQTEAFILAGNRVEKTINERPPEAIFIAQSIARRLELPKKGNEEAPAIYYGKQDPNMPVTEGKEAITVAGQNLSKSITAVLVQTFSRVGSKYIFDEPDVEIFDGEAAKISASMLDWFLEPDKAELYRQITNIKINDRLSGKHKKNGKLPN